MNIDKLWNFDDPVATQVRMEALIPEIQNQYPDKYLELLTQIARTYSLQRQFQQAHQLLNQVENNPLFSSLPLVQIRYLLERGRTYNSSGEPQTAMPLFTLALEIATTNQFDNFAVDAAHMLGIAAPTPQQQLEWNLHALTLAEKSTNPQAKQWLGTLYNNIGWTYFEQKNYQQALEFFEQGLAWRTQNKHPSNTILIARWSVARTWRALGFAKQALDEQLELVKFGEKHQLLPDGYVFEEIAEYLHAQGKHKEAEPYFAKAYELLSADVWLVATQPQRLIRLKKLANKQDF